MTAIWRTREELIQKLVTLARQGLSRRALARALGISRNTVKMLLAAHGTQREEEHKALAPPKLRAPRARASRSGPPSEAPRPPLRDSQERAVIP